MLWPLFIIRKDILHYYNSKFNSNMVKYLNILSGTCLLDYYSRDELSKKNFRFYKTIAKNMTL
ncbi:hypothetical protein CLOSBL3_10659 [Clostridiaceae bacterium BL-3]|nr:hypothetical protein CLOSBL3_10659 [Clostridiaceae bacterium BL-3]